MERIRQLWHLQILERTAVLGIVDGQNKQLDLKRKAFTDQKVCQRPKQTICDRSLLIDAVSGAPSEPPRSSLYYRPSKLMNIQLTP